MVKQQPEVTEIYYMLISAYEEGYKYDVIEDSSEGLMHGRLENVPFEYAIFMNLTQDHLNVHKTMQNYAKCKQMLFNQLKPFGKAIITSDVLHNEDFNVILDDMLNGLNNMNYEIEFDRKKAIIKGINLLNVNDVLLILGKVHEEVMIVKDKKYLLIIRKQFLNI